ncbi:hypothetical protein AMELA_G00064390 [Ameiurus melas]|uniref:Uncharacterized protein n=1 Tax=Ameiurus melas TaxID=219545 RepID=A0A7J6B6C9_AMEME|nr:hypothetical protein AMELA_G00064390 [Ameiurus melas]
MEASGGHLIGRRLDYWLPFQYVQFLQRIAAELPLVTVRLGSYPLEFLCSCQVYFCSQVYPKPTKSQWIGFLLFRFCRDWAEELVCLNKGPGVNLVTSELQPETYREVSAAEEAVLLSCPAKEAVPLSCPAEEAVLLSPAEDVPLRMLPSIPVPLRKTPQGSVPLGVVLRQSAAWQKPPCFRCIMRQITQGPTVGVGFCHNLAGRWRCGDNVHKWLQSVHVLEPQEHSKTQIKLKYQITCADFKTSNPQDVMACLCD